MSERIAQPFTEAEMQAIKRASKRVDRDEASVTRSFWGALKRIARNVPFAEDLVAAFYCAKDPATPARVRMILFGAIGYFVLPIDAISDFLPLIGFTDDMAVLALAIASVSNSITTEHRLKAKETLAADTLPE